jgi:hypothetical protein
MDASSDVTVSSALTTNAATKEWCTETFTLMSIPFEVQTYSVSSSILTYTFNPYLVSPDCTGYSFTY